MRKAQFVPVHLLKLIFWSLLPVIGLLVNGEALQIQISLKNKKSLILVRDLIRFFFDVLGAGIEPARL